MKRRAFLRLGLGLPALVAGGAAAWTWPAGHERLGASTACLAGRTLLEAFDVLEAMGFDTVELIAYTGARHSVGAIPGFDYIAAAPEWREQVHAATRRFRHLSAHMPFENVHLLSTDPGTRRAAVERVQGAIDGLAYLGGSLAVVHAGWPGQGRTYRELWRPMVETFRALGDYAAERGIRIGLETMQPDAVEAYVGLIADIDHPAVGATVDTGHIRGSTDIGLPPERRATDEGRARFNDVLEQLVEALGERVYHVHLSDVRATDWVDHRSVGTGIIDFARFFEALHRVRYEGLLVFELEEPDAIAALEASRAHVAPFVSA